MKIAAYVHWRRQLGHVTGVGRHIRSMVAALAQTPGVDVTVMAAKAELSVPGDTSLRALPIAPLPLSRALLERLWWATSLPKAERYVPDADWVYSPADTYVPTRRARLATTIHDIEIFEDDLPWSGTNNWERRRQMWRLRLGKMFKHARLILTVSEFSKRRMVDVLGVDPDRIIIVGNGVDDSFLDAGQSEQTRLQGEEWRKKYGPYLATVGGLSQRKGADYLFAVAAELRKRNSELRILVSGRNDPKYEQRLAEFPNVLPLGFVPDEALAGLLRGAVSLAFLSRYEGFGIPIVEAMACGTAAIVAPFASLPEVAGDVGIVVDVTKPAEIAELAMHLEKDAPRREELIRRGYVRAREFTWAKCVNRLMDGIRAADGSGA